ncbi:hypothetical protein HK097_008621 [Rhizophlyctis rosea]|uniref:Glycoside hydrolase family 28 n=1 Tax=Rhizophlyctis rosea TaxID=64517 RepID=A0AAD5X0Z6_9FUNG|nr:hypothetical protein HK097_008621 [Rhizophlyctis rosea]
MGLRKLGDGEGRIFVFVLQREADRPTGVLGRAEGLEVLRKVQKAICCGHGGVIGHIILLCNSPANASETKSAALRTLRQHNFRRFEVFAGTMADARKHLLQLAEAAQGPAGLPIRQIRSTNLEALLYLVGLQLLAMSQKQLQTCGDELKDCGIEGVDLTIEKNNLKANLTECMLMRKPLRISLYGGEDEVKELEAMFQGKNRSSNKFWNIKIVADNIGGTDGFDMSGNDNVVHDVDITNGDECVTVKTPSKNFFAYKMICRSTAGNRMGSFESPNIIDYQNLRQPKTGNAATDVAIDGVHYRNATMSNSQTGAQIKTYPNNNGYVRNVLYEDFKLQGILYPLAINLFWCPHITCPAATGFLTISNVEFRDFSGTQGGSGRPVALIDCISGH